MIEILRTTATKVVVVREVKEKVQPASSLFSDLGKFFHDGGGTDYALLVKSGGSPKNCREHTNGNQFTATETTEKLSMSHILRSTIKGVPVHLTD